MNSVGKCITGYVNTHNISICDFAKRADIDFRQVYHYINGTCLPSLINARKLCRVIGCTMDEFTEDIK